MLSILAFGLRGLTDRMRAGWATLAARHSATLASSARMLATGRVINIGNRSGAITIGANSHIGGRLLTFAHGGRITVGEWCFVGEGTQIWSASDIVIGDRVLVSHGVNIHDNDSHPLDPAARFAQTRAIFTTGHPTDIATIRSAPIRIGDDAWIGFGATIMKGVSIGDRAIVGANAIVRDDVPPDGMVVATADMPRTTVSGAAA
jgi:acetyltransferase-like isoleucine patch superfamily enzyme